MATMTIRKIDDQLKTHLHIQAARHGRSMDDEAREILRNALSTEPAQTAPLAEAIRNRIEPLGCLELQLPKREAIRDPFPAGD